jgi:hypothetical protein
VVGIKRYALLVALALLPTAAAATATAASAASFVVRGDTRIGTFAVKTDGKLGGAIKAFGSPSRKTHPFPSGCTVNWSAYGLTIEFYNLGGADPCTPSGGFFSRAVMHGKHWGKSKGLRIGMAASRVRQYYPRATWHRGLRGFWPTGWWLVARVSRVGLGDSRYPGLLAETRNGRVFSLQVRYPAGGD